MRDGFIRKKVQKVVSKTGVQINIRGSRYGADHKFVQNIDQHLLESITTSQKKSVFHEGFDSISGFLSVSKPYGLLTHCTNFCVSL